MTDPVTDPVDEATRFLASAVHLDDRIADLLVAEFLDEPKRAIPPSPGVAAEIVLREAVAAQAWRRLINSWLLGLLLVLTVLVFPLALAWLISAVAWRCWSAIINRLAVSQSGTHIGTVLAGPRQRWWATALLWFALTFIWLLPALAFVPFRSLSSEETVGTVVGAVLLISALLLLPSLYGLLVAKEYIRWRTADTWFGFGRFDPNTPPRESVVRACVRYADRLRRIRRADRRRSQHTSNEVIVYRGSKPFLGAGTRVRSWSAAVELRPTKSDSATDKPTDTSDGPVPTFTPQELQAYVRSDMDKLREAPNLTPGWRFGELGIADWAMVSASGLSYATAAAPLLQQLEAGTDVQFSDENWHDLANCSPEWLRYYQCFRLEGWARQLAVSGFLHVGCEERMLVLEWHGFVLPPISSALRRVDEPPTMVELSSMWKALTEFALLPSTVPGRMSDVVRGMRAGRSRGLWSTPTQAAQVFGASASVRELAAGNRLNNLFQESDCDRYLKILERRALHAVRRFLREKGISASGFDEMVTQINNSTVLNNSNVIAGNVGGQGNTGTVQSGEARSESAAD